VPKGLRVQISPQPYKLQEVLMPVIIPYNGKILRLHHKKYNKEGWPPFIKGILIVMKHGWTTILVDHTCFGFSPNVKFLYKNPHIGGIVRTTNKGKWKAITLIKRTKEKIKPWSRDE